MKVLLKKFNKTKLSTRLVYILVSLLFLVSYIFLFINIFKLTGIANKIRIIVLVVLGLLVILYSFGDLLLLLTKKNKTVYFTSFIALILACACVIGSLAINRALSALSNMSKDTIVYTTNLIAMAGTEYKNDKDFTIGIINNETDTEGNTLAYELIAKDDMKNTIKKYDTYFAMLEDLYAGKINALFITSNYVVIYSTYDAYANIGTDTVVLKEYSKEMKNQDYIESSGSVTKPFIVLIMGVDSPSPKLNANAAFNGDTLMLVSFNPKTLDATIFSIPRDTYVPIACLNGGSSKINSSAAYGTNCVINTVQNLIGINIDYYVKVDFKGVIDLVNALGGIDITVPDNIDFCESNQYRSTNPNDLICIKSGYQHMTGEQALAFARHRHTLPAGDFQRVQHQQLIVGAAAQKVKEISSVNEFYSVLDAVSDNMDTNMQTSDMLALYSVIRDTLGISGSTLNIQKTYLTGYSLTMYVDNLRANVYTFQYYPQSLEEITNAMKVTLGLKKATMVKTFNFSVNDEYEQTVIGKQVYTVTRNETVPSFTGQTLDYVEAWAQTRNINIIPNYITVRMNGYDDTLADGTVVAQSVVRGKLVKDISSITVNVIKKSNTTEATTTEDTTDTETNKSNTLSSNKSNNSDDNKGTEEQTEATEPITEKVTSSVTETTLNKTETQKPS